MISAINGYQEQAILFDSHLNAGAVPRIDGGFSPFGNIMPENENDKILREKFANWKKVFPQKVLRADALLSKAE